MNQGKGGYRVLLISFEDNTEAGKESFCYNVCENFSISFPVLKKIVDRCPIVLKKNLSLEKAAALAKTLKSFGAIVSVEEKRDSTAIFLEFEGIEPHGVALESSSLRRTESGAWNVIGRVKNISEENLNGTWVLIQLFDDLEEFLTFEEAPIPINPLPPWGASPFKVAFEGALPIKKVSIAFKNTLGHPLSAADRRKKRDWIKVEIGDEDKYFPPTPPSSFALVDESESQSVDIAGLSEEISNDKYSETPREYYQPFELETPSFSIEGGSHETMPESLGGSEDSILGIVQGENEKGEREETLRKDETSHPLPSSPLEEREEKERTVLLEWESHAGRPQEISSETPSDASADKETTPSIEDTSKIIGEGEMPPPPISWTEAFRNSIDAYYQKPRGIFIAWFRAERDRGGFINSLHSLLTILVYARFDQMNHSEKALENVQRVFQLSIQPDLQLEQIPPLEETEFFSAEDWRVLFHRAIPKLQQVSNTIFEKGQWEALDLEHLIQVIPHISHKNSRMAVRWVHELIPDIITIDFSNNLISVGESLYRVVSRLGVVDPDGDFYQGENSIGDLKIQSFGKTVFPQDPLKIEEPLTWVGRREEGGHCFPTLPRCTGCLFEAFCPKLYSHFNPSEKGMRQDK
jgi:hypothetical protein